MFFARSPFLHLALDGMAGGGGVYVRGLPWLFYLDLSINGVHVALKRPCETLQLFFTEYRAFFLVIHHPFCFFMNALPTWLCPSEIFFSSNLQGWCWLGIPPALLPFSIKKQRQKRYFLRGGCRNLNTLLASVLLVFCFRISPVLAGSMEFSGGFWQPSSLSFAPQVGFLHMTSSPIGEEASPWAIHPPKRMEVRCPQRCQTA